MYLLRMGAEYSSAYECAWQSALLVHTLAGTPAISAAAVTSQIRASIFHSKVCRREGIPPLMTSHVSTPQVTPGTSWQAHWHLLASAGLGRHHTSSRTVHASAGPSG